MKALRIFLFLFAFNVWNAASLALANSPGAAQRQNPLAISKPSPTAGLAPHAPPPPLPENPPTAPPSPNRPQIFSVENLQHFVRAFLRASSDPDVGAEVKFFADRVNYFGQPNVSPEEIRRELALKAKRWPERHFTLAGAVEIQSREEGRVRVAFPLRYELRNGAKHSSGASTRTLIIQRTAPNELKIVAMNERQSGVGQTP